MICSDNLCGAVEVELTPPLKYLGECGETTSGASRVLQMVLSSFSGY